MVCAALAAEGCEAAECEGAEGLVARARDGAFDLVLADVDALGVGPGELTRRVKCAAPCTTVLILSHDASAAAPVEALRAGAWDYLRTPLRPEELRERLRHALAGRHLGLTVRQRSLQLAFINELSGAFSASLDLDRVLRAAAGALRAFADFDLAAAVLRNASGDTALVHQLTPDAGSHLQGSHLHFAHGGNVPNEDVTPGGEVRNEDVTPLWQPPAEAPIARSALGMAFDGTRPLTASCGDTLETECVPQALTPDLAGLRGAGFRSFLFLPLAGGTRSAANVSPQAVGVVVLASRRPGAFAEADLDLFQHVGDHLSSAVVNARLYGELKALSARLEDEVRERTREAREAQQHLESLLETAGDAIITVDPDRRITSWNNGARQVLGYLRDEMQGRDLCTLASGEGARDQLAELVASTLAGQVSSNVETAWLRKDRKEVSVSLTVSPVWGHIRNGMCPPPQRLAGVLVIARDITERKRLQEELFHSEKLASIGQLAAGVAHQINNPLGAISGRAQMLLRLSGPPHQEFLREQLAKIRADCARIAETINDLLGFARKADTAKQPTDLHGVLDETLEMVTHGLAAPDVHVERRYAERLPPVLASANHLRQLFANLVANAFDAMPAGGTLTVASRCLAATPERPERIVEVTVADTGVGIAPDDLPRIFEPFYTTKPPGQGTGLGLAVAKRIADFHNGRIDVASTPGAGTTFTVQFPVG